MMFLSVVEKFSGTFNIINYSTVVSKGAIFSSIGASVASTKITLSSA